MRYSFVIAIVVLSISVTPAAAQEDARPPNPIGIGDGVADDTAAIQRAVDAGIGDIPLGKGIYRLTAPIVIDLDKVTNTSIHGNGVARIVMEAAGPAFRFVGTHEGTAAPQTIQRNVWDRQASPMVDGIEIVGKHPQACGIEASGTMQLTLSRVVVREALHGIHLVGRNRNVTLSQCHLYDNTGVGVFMDRLNLHQINIANCHISYNDGGGVVVTNSEIRNLQIGTCDIEGNMGGDESAATANILLDSANSSIGEVAIVGCTIQHAHDAPNSANIRINGRSQPVRYAEELRHGNITIADNVLSDVQVNVDIRDVRGLSITGNTMWQGYTNNMLLENCQNVVLSGNVFDRNPRYNYGDAATARLGVVFTNSQDCTIVGNHFYGEVFGDAAMVLRGCRRFNVTSCTILDYGKCGLLLDHVSNSRVSDCLIRDDRQDADGVSLRIVEPDNVQVTDCQLSHADQSK